MKETFRKNLEIYKKLASEKIARGPSAEDEELTRVINWHIADATKNRSSNPLTQTEIFELQIKKQQIILNLKKAIKNLDDITHVPEIARDQRVVKLEGDKYFTKNDSNEPVEITPGEILTDFEWGIGYFLDPESTPRNLRKRYLIEHARYQLSNLLTQQMTKDEIGSRDTDPFKKQAYTEISKRAEHRTMQGGIIAETMVKNFFKKLAIDNNIDIEIIEADAQQDVEAKIDFIIRRKRHIRGVGVETTKNERIGIQFTTNFEAVLHKEDQIRRVKSRIKKEEKVVDLVLVAMPMDLVMKAYYKWQADGKVPGGPDKFLSPQDKKIIFSTLLQKMLEPAEITSKWGTINNLSRHGEI